MMTRTAGQHGSGAARVAQTATALVLGLAVAAGCQDVPSRAETSLPQLQWRDNCAPIARPAPLSLDAARDAYRSAQRRQELRLREAAAPGALMREIQARFDEGTAPAFGNLCLSDFAELGERLFEHEFHYADGLGGGAAARARKGPFRRVHEGLFGGPETISCPSCHWVGGPNGAGAETDNAFLSGDGAQPGSGDARNPNALVALGVVQALASEMSEDLQQQRDALQRDARSTGEPREQRLSSKGVDFGTLRVAANGEIDTSAIDGVDADLVVKPFGWKGTRPDIASFSTEALQVHLGIQGDDLIEAGPGDFAGRGPDPLDLDGDGVKAEFGRSAIAALTVHLALLEMPIVEPLIQDQPLEPAASGLLPPTTTSFVEDFARGRERFHALGCAGCHRPMLLLKSPILRADGLPPTDLAREMRRPELKYDPMLEGYPVWLFSDLRRHDMGKANTARHLQRGVGPGEYLTPRLWGVADSAPYLHDGRAPSFDYAIAGHDGEGTAARAAYAALPQEEKGALRVYLMSLRRASRVMIP